MPATNKKLCMTSKGSFTIEASIIFSVVFLLVAALVYLFIIMYQYAFLQSIASQAANVGSYNYVNQYGAEYTSKSNFNLYWRIIDTDSVNKKSTLNSYIDKRLDQSFLDSARYSDNVTSYKFLLQQLNISIEERYPIPIGNLFKLFGISPTLNLKAETASPLDDNAEFIRNLDIVIDIKNCILNSDNKWIGEDSKVNDILDKLLKKN
ncbi:MAG: TadE/TadG family type IV pilus assembly protein [Ruminiclostridium sp.]